MPLPLAGLALRAAGGAAISRLGPSAGRSAVQTIGTGGGGSGLRQLGSLLGGRLGVGAIAGGLVSEFVDIPGIGFGGGGGAVTGPVQRLENGMIFPSGEVLGKVWSTNGQFNNMGMTLDGKKGVALRNDGTVRFFRYQKHIVLPSNPRVGTFNRATKRIDTMTKRIAKANTRLKRA